MVFEPGAVYPKLSHHLVIGDPLLSALQSIVMLKLVGEDAVITPVALPGTVAVLGVPFTAPESAPLIVLIARILTE